MSSYRRLNQEPSLLGESCLDANEFGRLMSETDAAIRGFDARLQSARNDRERRQVRQKLPSITNNINSLHTTLEMWKSNPRKHGMTDRDIQSRTTTLTELENAFNRLQQNLEKGDVPAASKAQLMGGYVPLSRPAEDNEDTQFMSNKELLDDEVERVQMEDEALGNISQGLTQLNYVAKAQNKQLLKQEGLINDLKDGLDQTDRDLQGNLKRVDIVEEKSRGGCYSLLLMAALLALIVSVIVSNWMCHILPNIKKNQCK